MYKNNRITLLAFGTEDLIRTKNRLYVQAKESQYYDDIKILGPKDFDDNLKSQINFFLNQKKNKGYAYWYWKPNLIKNVMNNLSEGEIVQYIDIGCHIIKNKNKRFNEYLDILIKKENWILPFQYHDSLNTKFSSISFPKREEFKFTKADLFEYFNFLNKREIIDTPQFWAGNIFFKKCQKSQNFLLEWIDIMINNFHLIDDTHSNIKNHNDFIEHRHDQSVYSLLCKKYKLFSLSAYEFDWAIKNNQRTWDNTLNSPFQAKRDKKYNLMKRFINRQKKNLKRLFKI